MPQKATQGSTGGPLQGGRGQEEMWTGAFAVWFPQTRKSEPGETEARETELGIGPV